VAIALVLLLSGVLAGRMLALSRRPASAVHPGTEAPSPGETASVSAAADPAKSRGRAQRDLASLRGAIKSLGAARAQKSAGPRVQLPTSLTPFQEAVLANPVEATLTRSAAQREVQARVGTAIKKCVSSPPPAGSFVEVDYVVVSRSDRLSGDITELYVGSGAPLDDQVSSCLRSAVIGQFIVNSRPNSPFLEAATLPLTWRVPLPGNMDRAL
jgi:hypothetical protein